MTKKKKIILSIMAVTLIVIYNFFGFYTIKPIKALPNGSTAIVLRESNEPFFNSIDYIPVHNHTEVNAGTRIVAMQIAPGRDRILVILPYIHILYLFSTNGNEF